MTIHSYFSITHTDIDTYTGLNAVTAVISPLNDPHSSPPQMSSESASHTLYCAEDAADLDSSDADTCIPHHHHHPPPPPFTSSSPHSPPSDEGAAVAELIDSEARHMPEPDYLRRCCNVTARQDSVNWILKVHARHRFSPATAFLSVNYFDRFLSSCSLPKPNGWPFQLLSVVCLSLAAKMEEPRVPLLLDLQMCDPKYVFEPKTVQRMELWVMSNLDWRLRSVTPFDFLHFFISKLPSSSSSSSSLDHLSLSRIFSASSDLVLSTTRVTDFLRFTPSTMAAAAVLCATREISDGQLRVCHDATTSFHERVNKEMVRSCQQLMEEHLLDTCPASRRKERRPEPVAPPSPVAVLDAAACVSCDTRSETPGSTTTTTTGNKAEAAPPKRPRTSTPDVQQR